jgi:hypothetical protein
LQNNLLLRRAGSWFLNSGIQEPLGGVARYYCSETQENRLASTEITGYAVSTFVYLHSITGEEGYLSAARDAGLFLTRTVWNAADRVFPFEFSASNPPPVPLAYFFDTGIIARGLLHLWKATGDEEFRTVAIKAACAMADHFPESGAGFIPILTLPSREPVPLGKTWSRLPGCYQLKSALAWDQVGVETGNRALQDRFEQALSRALASHEQFLPGVEGDGVMDRLHAYCYFLEALLARARRKECASALRSGIERVSRHLRTIAPAFARSDVYAQLLRVRLWAEQLGVGVADRLSAEEEAQNLARYQISSLDRRMEGGFYFGSRRGHFIPHVNPVSTGFGLQALAMWDQFRQGKPVTPPEAMI